ncbi:hypothetical protein LSCM1_04724 [Leishmania martiniquensis]|uniref:Guanine nucleotide-binding protein subunit beta-like protein n=1 Tax=Leishmania martiniquensis TaxID=1580590 RepID=A0A836GQI9_9TRYP|nr:hypothetical protein LSCM1_04724 [Leishmania martiniquensis]
MRAPVASMPRKPGNAKSKGTLSAHRRNGSGCDGVTVCGRFDGQSRCSTMALNGMAWTGERDGAIATRLTPSGMEVGRIKPNGRSMVLVIANVGDCIWVGYSDGAIRVFDHATHKLLRESTQHTAAVYAMCAAGDYVYTGGADWKVHEWEAADLRYSRMFYGHRSTVRSLTTYLDQQGGHRYVVSGSDDGTIKVWKAATTRTSRAKTEGGDCVATLEKQGLCILSVLVLDDTAELWAGSEDSAIRVWDLCTLAATNIIRAHRAPVVALQKVDETVWSGSKDGAIAVTNRFSKEILYRATQPLARSRAAARTQRFAMSILPVTHSFFCNVWTTAADGSWQSWDVSLSGGAKQSADKACVLMRGRQPLQSRKPRSSRGGRHRGDHASRGAVDANKYKRSRSASALPENRVQELRESVAQLRRTVAALLADSADVHPDNGSGVNDTGDVVNRYEAQNAGGVDDDDGGIPLDAVAESIRDDYTAEAQREVHQLQAELAVERRKSAELRTELEKMGKGPHLSAAEGAKVSGRTESPAMSDAPAEANARERHGGQSDDRKAD